MIKRTINSSRISCLRQSPLPSLLFEDCHQRQREIDLLAEYIWPAMCSFDQRLPDVFVDSWETFPVNMPAAAGLRDISNTTSPRQIETYEYA